jgi:transcriptional regulator with XRE-family HTH domain
MTQNQNSPAMIIAAALRRERARDGATLTDVARRAGIGKSTLSELESGTGNPSLETLWALAVALGIPVSRLLDPPTRRVKLVRAGEAPTLTTTADDYRASLLDTASPNGRRDIYRITAEPGDGRQSEPHMPGSIEQVILTTGRAVVGPTANPETLQPGDYISYPGDQPHTFRALTRRTTAVLIQENT